MTETAHHLPFREYLRLQGTRGKDPPKDDEYDSLILMAWEFFSLRVRAEDYFEKHTYVAKSARGALPLPWREIKAEFERSGPPETTLTLIAKRYFGTIDTLAGNIRKVLKREREKVPIGRVQQVDSHCLRWLTRQPGCSPVEKAGARQEILGVVRRENFDTLENRVLKDFLRRCLALSSMYLRKYEQEWPNEATIIAVKRLKGLCIGALELPEFEKVKAIADLPQPNFVLQQDRLYSRIWGEYLKILREEDVSERMWDRRSEVAELHKQLHKGVALHCSPCAKYNTPIWFNELDGRNPILEAPIWDNDILPSPVLEPDIPKEDVVAIDLTTPWDGRDELVVPAKHPNARPFIQNPHRPSQEQGETLRLEQILEDNDAVHLSDYLRHLHGILGGKRWIVLVPDHWDAVWLERVIGARPPAIGSRSNFFLLWRSVAAALGYAPFREIKDGESLFVKDAYSKGKCNGVVLRFMADGNGEAIPQRASLRLHGENAPESEIRFATGETSGETPLMKKFERKCSFVVQCGLLTNDNDWLIDGARYFDEKRCASETAYFDEMDALSLVVTNQAEEVELNTLVIHDERHPGGTEYIGEEQYAGSVSENYRHLLLYLAEGTLANDTRLDEKRVEFDDKLDRVYNVRCKARITPGQGLATITFFAPFLKRPLEVNLGDKKPSSVTKSRIERELKRHFPPDMPLVEACNELWEKGVTAQSDVPICERVRRYLNGEASLESDSFALAQSYWGDVGKGQFRQCGIPRTFDRDSMSPTDKFKRENVFGNAEGGRVPIADERLWDNLFRRLAADYKHGGRCLRLIAWTYQFDSDYFEEIREEMVRRYTREFAVLRPEEITFCANCFSAEDYRTPQLLESALQRIVSRKYNPDDLRLAYNLMQFHKSVLETIPSGLCLNAFKTLYYDFNEDLFFVTNLFGRELRYSRNHCAAIASAYLRCMLFLLHRRRYDSDFMKTTSEWRPKRLLGKSLNFISGNQERTRITLLEYVHGRGTLEGLLQMMFSGNN